MGPTSLSAWDCREANMLRDEGSGELTSRSSRQRPMDAGRAVSALCDTCSVTSDVSWPRPASGRAVSALCDTSSAVSDTSRPIAAGSAVSRLCCSPSVRSAGSAHSASGTVVKRLPPSCSSSRRVSCEGGGRGR